MPSAVAGLFGLGFRGANVTMPHKEKVIRHLDETSGDASVLADLGVPVPVALDRLGVRPSYVMFAGLADTPVKLACGMMFSGLFPGANCGRFASAGKLER